MADLQPFYLIVQIICFGDSIQERGAIHIHQFYIYIYNYLPDLSPHKVAVFQVPDIDYILSSMLPTFFSETRHQL